MSPSRFAGKVGVITGGASGIGLATAKRLLGEDGAVVLLDRTAESFVTPRHELAEHQGHYRTLVADVSNLEAMRRAAEEVSESFSRVDALVNSAGVLRWGGTLDTAEGDWDELMRVNLKGTWLSCRSFLPLLGSGASIVNVASNMGTKGVANQIAYSASKGGVIALTRSMAVELGPQGIRVNCVNPGHIRTPMGDSAAERLGLTDEGIRSKYPLGRLGKAEEVASAIAYLVSDEAAFLTGAIVPVDGGYTA